MSTIAIITDSTAYIPEKYLREYPIYVIPLLIIWGNETFHDGVDIKPSEFYTRLEKSSVIPTTSQPTPNDYKQLYDRLLEKGHEILVVTISSKLSGTMDSAILAKAMLPGAPIEIVDSLSTAMAMGYQVLAGARAIKNDSKLTEIKSVVEKAREHSGVVFTPVTLKYLHLGGRIGGATRYLGNALNIKPILDLENGVIEALERMRTRPKALNRVVEIVAQRAGNRPIRLGALHANAIEDAQSLIDEASKKMKVIESVVTDVSPAIGVHAGPGTAGLAYMIE
ncbi:MAG: DegV family protein [Anaerolineales bacterium]|nr:DegV family protein [Anaerolineales bacterium]